MIKKPTEDVWKLAELEDQLGCIDLPPEPVDMGCYKITNISGFINSHLHVCRQHNGQFWFAAHLKRLKDFIKKYS